MKRLCFALIFLTFFCCTNSKTNRTELIHYLPKESTVIIKASNFESLKNSYKNNSILSQFTRTESHSNLSSKFNYTNLIDPQGEVIVGFSEVISDSIDYTFVTKYHKDLFKKDSLSDYVEETLKYGKKEMIKSSLNGDAPFFSTVIDSVFIGSSSKDVILAAFEKTTLDEDIEKMYKATGDSNTLSLIVKNTNPFIEHLFLNDSIPLKKFTDYIVVDTDLDNNAIRFNGITKSSDSLKFLNIFKNTVPQENQMHLITPANSDGFLSITFDDFNILKSNSNSFDITDSLNTDFTLFENLTEVGVIYEDKKRAVVLNSIDVIATNDALIAEQNRIGSYRQVDIFDFSNSRIFSTAFSPFITSNGYNQYCKIDSFFVFAQDLEMLQNIIANYQNKTTLSERSYYKTLREGLSDASSLLHVGNASSLESIFKKNIKTPLKFNLKDYKASAIQFVYDNNFAHVNGVIAKNKSKVREASVTEEFSIRLDNDILNDPLFVKNHITKQKEIVIQDVNNNLYLISNKGKILWKKQLHGPVLGKINQIDIYKNGRLQLAFATPNRVYILDRNGRDVAPFPGKFNDKITQPLSVFDYDKKKNYRLLVTQGKNLLMYNTKAKIVNGFTFKKAAGTIIHQPQHFRIGSKDYITVKTFKKLHILDRTGKNRVTPKTNSTFSNEAIYLYKNKFTTTSADGKLVSIDSKGNMGIQNLNLSEDHHITGSSKTLVTQTENKLSIRGKSLEIDFGNYTAPKLFYINDKIYVTNTDLQTQKVYLYDSQTKSIPNFPVYGNSTIELDNIDKDQNLEFVTKGDTNSILLYQIN